MEGKTAFEAAQIDQWVQFAATEIDLPASVWVFPILGYIPNNAVVRVYFRSCSVADGPNGNCLIGTRQATSKAKGDMRKVFELLNKHLATRTYLVGERVTLADLAVASSLYHVYQLVAEPGFRKAFGNVTRWYLTIVNQPNVKPVFGDVKLCEKAQVAPGVSSFAFVGGPGGGVLWQMCCAAFVFQSGRADMCVCAKLCSARCRAGEGRR